MRNKIEIKEWGGIVLLVFITLFTLLFSLVYAVDGSNADYMHYMQLVATGDSSDYPMIAGTLALYKPVYNLLGNSYWAWRMITWGVNALTLFVPFFALLNGRQQRRYAFVAALMMLVLQQRFGCEPYKPVYLFAAIMLVCFVKYANERKFLWLFIVSALLPLIAFTRFPSLFVYPLLLLATALLNKRRNLMHTLVVAAVPPLLFWWLVSMTNGGMADYLHDLTGNVGKAATGGHSFDEIFWSEVESVVHACGYAFFIIMPFMMYALWKIKDKGVYKLLMLFFALVIAAIMLYHPTQHLSCALMMVVTLFYCYGKKFSLESIVMGATVIVTAMFCCVGSDCGFVHDYMCACFLPYFAVHTPSIDIVHPREVRNGNKIWRLVNDGLFHRLFIVIVLVLTASTLFNRMNNLYGKISEGGEICAINAGEIAPNLHNLYFGKGSFENLSALQKEKQALSKQYDDVIFWGMTAHLMGIANNKWPVSNSWWTGSKDINSKAFRDFTDYVSKNHPVVIDTERHKATEEYLLSIGYEKACSQSWDVYIKQK